MEICRPYSNPSFKNCLDLEPNIKFAAIIRGSSIEWKNFGDTAKILFHLDVENTVSISAPDKDDRYLHSHLAGMHNSPWPDTLIVHNSTLDADPLKYGSFDCRCL